MSESSVGQPELPEKSGSFCPYPSSSDTNFIPWKWFHWFQRKRSSGDTKNSRSVDSEKLGSCSFFRGEINEANQMPALTNDITSPAHALLSTERQKSSIPKSGARNEVWEYPSSRQFCKALELRNKEADISAMDDVVYVHNSVNEDTWKGILEWEKMHYARCPTPSLIRFVGRYNDLTWKAFWKSRFTSLGCPFDRHDWLVDRCGTQVRYIIDYYDDPRKTDDLQVTLDIRPAPDTIYNIYDRLRKPLHRFLS